MSKKGHIVNTRPASLKAGEYLLIITYPDKDDRVFFIQPTTSVSQVEEFVKSYAYHPNESELFNIYSAQRRYPIRVKCWEGYLISYKDLLGQLKARKEHIQPADILRSWGLKFPEDRREWYQHLKFIDDNTVELIQPPHEVAFDTAFENIAKKNRQLPEIKTLHHGTRNLSIVPIIREGLKLPKYYGQANGAGIYLGNPDKAKNYASGGWSWNVNDPVNKFKFILQVDAILGNVFQAKELLKDKAPEYIRNNGYDSLYYKGFQRPEWTIYNPSQILIKKIIRVS